MSDANKTRELMPEAWIPYLRYADETTLVLRTGALMTCIALDGAAFETADTLGLNIMSHQLNIVLKDLADERLALWSHVVRRRTTSTPEGVFESDFARSLDAKYRAKVLADKMFTNELFLTLVWVPNQIGGAKVGAVLKKFKKARAAGIEVNAADVKALHDKVSQVTAGLGAYRPRVLGLYEHEGIVFAEPSELLHRLVGGRRERVPLTDGPVSSAIYSDRVICGKETIEHRYESSVQYSGIFGFKDYPSVTRPGMLNGVLGAPFELVLSQSFKFLAKVVAQEIMGRKQNQMGSSGDRAVSQLEELSIAANQLESNHFVMGEHHCSLAVFADTLKELGDNLSAARVHLTSGGAVIAREDRGLAAAWLAQMPGNFSFRARPATITSRNFAGLSSFHSYPQGRADGNHWGPAVALLKTASGAPYMFSFHVDDLGNTFLCGPSGGGKTALINFLIAQSLKFDPDIVLVDKDQGARLFIQACGGTYLTLQNGKPTGLAPLKGLHLTPGNKTFLETWVTSLVKSERPLTAVERADIAFAIDGVATMPVEQRNISALRGFIDTTGSEGVAARLLRWEKGQPLGWVFDNDADYVGAEAKVVGYDMTDFLDNAEINGPVNSYLFLRFNQRLDGKRKVIGVIDEFWKALADEGFRELVRDQLKTIRKKNGLLVFATQSPSDALRSDIARTIIEQCPTKIFLPNASGDREDYVGGFKLTAREFELITSDLSKESRSFLIKQGQKSVVAKLDLNGFDRELDILSGRTGNVDLLETILAEMKEGAAPDAWLDTFHERRQEQRKAKA